MHPGGQSYNIYMLRKVKKDLKKIWTLCNNVISSACMALIDHALLDWNWIGWNNFIFLGGCPELNCEDGVPTRDSNEEGVILASTSVFVLQPGEPAGMFS